MKESGNTILVQSDLPTDYGVCRMMLHDGLPLNTNGDFYVITHEKNIVVRSYLEDGFSFEDKPFMDKCDFVITGYVRGGMGMWEVTFRVSIDSGLVKNMYELNSTIKDKD